MEQKHKAIQSEKVSCHCSWLENGDEVHASTHLFHKNKKRIIITASAHKMLSKLHLQPETTELKWLKASSPEKKGGTEIELFAGKLG